MMGVYNDLKELLELKIRQVEINGIGILEPEVMYQTKSENLKISDLIDFPSEIFPPGEMFTGEQILELNFLIEILFKKNNIIVHLNPIFPNHFRYECLVNLFSMKVKFEPSAIIQFHFCTIDFKHCMMEETCICKKLKNIFEEYKQPYNFRLDITD